MIPPDKVRTAHEITGSNGRMDQPLAEEYRLCIYCEKQKGDTRGPAPTPQATQTMLEDWSEYLFKWDLKYPVKAYFEAYIDGAGHLRIHFRYPEEKNSREPDKLLEVSRVGLLAPSCYPDHNSPRWIRANLLYHLEHELDEWLQFEGTRPFDPHHMSSHSCAECDAKMAQENSTILKDAIRVIKEPT